VIDHLAARRTPVFCWLVCLVVLAGGCMTAEPSTGAAGATRPPGTGPGHNIDIVDGRGERIVLKASANRIVTIPMPSASILMAVDGGPQDLVGVHPASMAAVEEGILKKVYPGALDVRTDFIASGFSPNVEQLLTLQPDVVFQWAGRGEDLIVPMESAGLTVIGIEYGDQEQLENLMRMKGRAVDQSDKVERIIDYHHKMRNEIAARAHGIPHDQRPRVLYFLRYADQLRVSGTDTYNDFYIDLAGGDNVAAVSEPTGLYDVNLEQVVAWAPEVILLGGFDAAVPADVYANPVLQAVSAVKNRRVYKVPLGGYRWDPPSQESPLMWLWLAQLLHPDVFGPVHDLRAEMKDFYGWVYGYDLTEEDIDSILRTSPNQEAVGYEQFAAP
jgi:iron complex transport system substrate-binding protein